jgi:hypothetical protein
LKAGTELLLVLRLVVGAAPTAKMHLAAPGSMAAPGSNALDILDTPPQALLLSPPRAMRLGI